MEETLSMTQTVASHSQLWEAMQGVGRWLFASVVAAVFSGMAACICVCVKAMEMFRHMCVCRGGSEEAERTGDIYVFYSGKGGGVKSPDP